MLNTLNHISPVFCGNEPHRRVTTPEGRALLAELGDEKKGILPLSEVVEAVDEVKQAKAKQKPQFMGKLNLLG